MDLLESLLQRTQTEREYLDKALREHPLLLFLISKKGAGKSTRIKLIQKALPRHFETVPAGDLARGLQNDLQTKSITEVANSLRPHMDESFSIEDIYEQLVPFVELEGTRLKSTDIMFALVKRELAKHHGKSIILDGFPRSPEQIHHAKQLIQDFESKNYHPLFVYIEIPSEVQDMRMRHRRICPNCGNSNNLLIYPTKELGYDEQSDEYFMYCDGDSCEMVRMVEKAYDSEGAEQMAERDRIVQELIDQLRDEFPHLAHTISNAIELEQAHEYESHDLTEMTKLSYDGSKVKKETEPLIVTDDSGKKAYSGNPEPWVLDFLKLVSKRYQQENY